MPFFHSAGSADRSWVNDFFWYGYHETLSQMRIGKDAAEAASEERAKLIFYFWKFKSRIIVSLRPVF